MGKKLYISEKPSVAQEFAKALHEHLSRGDGYLEGENSVVTWCVGHLVTMSYPEVYDPALKKWTLAALPFLPKEFRYEVIPAVKKQFEIVKKLLNREDVETIYVCTDSGREGEYIYRLVDRQAKVPEGKDRRRVWIDSQTEEEILRGIREAKPESAYDNLAAAAYLRAKEDYLMGINFSRVLTLQYGNSIQNYRKTEKWAAVAVGRVMTCVLGIVVRREREIRNFVETPFYRVVGTFVIGEAPAQPDAGTQQPAEAAASAAAGTGETAAAAGEPAPGAVSAAAGTKPTTSTAVSAAVSMEEAVKASPPQPVTLEGEWRAVPGSRYAGTPALYKENGFKERKDAEALVAFLSEPKPVEAEIASIEKKKETKAPPLLYNLAELQNDCSRFFKISPDQTLAVIQELYEKKLVTYPRTDARVLSSAVAKEITKNIGGLKNFGPLAGYARQILERKTYEGIEKTRYVDDKQITDHYAIVPTGQGFGALNSLKGNVPKIYELIARRFLAIFCPPAEYQKAALVFTRNGESFFANVRVLMKPGYLAVMGPYAASDQKADDARILEALGHLRKGRKVPVQAFEIKDGKTSPPKRYSSGALILTMENAGQFIEDEDLRAQMKGSGIGTSATRAEIISKLVKNDYLKLAQKTQIITPTELGEMVYDVVDCSIRQLLVPELTASWEKGLTYVAEGSVTEQEYLDKLEGFVTRMTIGVKGLHNQAQLQSKFDAFMQYYKSGKGGSSS